jgi:hypothetical protein
VSAGAALCIVGGYFAVFGLLFLRIHWPRRCVWMRWHRWTHWERVTENCDRYACSCGRHWAMHREIRFPLPWEQVSNFYDGPTGMRQFPPRRDARPS